MAFAPFSLPGKEFTRTTPGQHFRLDRDLGTWALTAKKWYGSHRALSAPNAHESPGEMKIARRQTDFIGENTRPHVPGTVFQEQHSQEGWYQQ